jgi:hypothetical protein
MANLQSSKNIGDFNTPGFNLKKDETDVDSNDSSFIAKQKELLKGKSQKFSDIYNKSLAKKNSLRKSQQESSGESEIIEDETLYSVEDEEENDEDMVFDVRVSNCLFT